MTPSHARRGLVISTLALGFLAGTGCSRSPSRVELPAISAGAGAAALAEYDANKDGKISGAELGKAASLQAALDQVDADKDKAITAEEIDARIAHWREEKVALMAVTCKVLVNGTPVANATVTFEPEAFLGSAFHPASGVTNEEGVAIMALANEHVPDPKFSNFLTPGFYKISAEVAGKKYTAGPRTGCEVAVDAGWLGDGCVTAEFVAR